MTRSRAREIVLQIFTLMKALPFVRFGLALGGGVVFTGITGWLIWLHGYKEVPGATPEAIERIHGLTTLGIGAMVLIGIVLVGMVWGQLDKANVKIGNVDVEFDFERPKDEGSDAPR